MQLEDASGSVPWLYVSSVEFARKVGAGAQFMSGSFLKSVAGSGGGGVLVSFFPAQPKSLGHCVLSNI